MGHGVRGVAEDHAQTRQRRALEGFQGEYRMVDGAEPCPRHHHTGRAKGLGELQHGPPRGDGHPNAAGPFHQAEPGEPAHPGRNGLGVDGDAGRSGGDARGLGRWQTGVHGRSGGPRSAGHPAHPGGIGILLHIAAAGLQRFEVAHRRRASWLQPGQQGGAYHGFAHIRVRTGNENRTRIRRRHGHSVSS
jgi:hypothetical protein